MNVFEGYRITSPYGNRKSPITGKEEKHTGIDLSIKHQADIKSFTDGVVVHAKFAEMKTGLGGYGNTVCIVDKKGYLHLYGHLDSIDVKLNERVTRGKVIGKQGYTGQSAGSHLHYEVRSKDNPSFGWGFDVEPTNYLDNFLNQSEVLNNNNIEEIINYLSQAWRLSNKESEKARIHELAEILRKEKK